MTEQDLENLIFIVATNSNARSVRTVIESLERRAGDLKPHQLSLLEKLKATLVQ